jgi:hypothetical protein
MPAISPAAVTDATVVVAGVWAGIVTLWSP